MADELKPVPSPGTVLMKERCDVCYFPRDGRGVLVHDAWCWKKNQETVVNGVVIERLVNAYAHGASDTEAAIYGGISPSVLSKYKKAHPDFAEHVQALKQTPVLRARESVNKHMADDGNLALKFLERRKKDEFSPRLEHTGADGADLPAPILSNVINVEAKEERPDDEEDEDGQGILDEIA